MKKGFTILELLVVISIISLLIGVILISLQYARQAANDTYRIESLYHIRMALELYYDTVGSYPVTLGVVSGCPTSAGDLPGYCPPYDGVHRQVPQPVSDGWDSSSPLMSLVSNGFLKEIPIDPVNQNGHWIFYRGSAEGYVIGDTLERGGFGIMVVGGKDKLAWMNVSNNGILSSLDTRLMTLSCGSGITPQACNRLFDFDCDKIYSPNDIAVVQTVLLGMVSSEEICGN